MDFDRVRTPEQRLIRINQIKEAAIKLFDSMQYHKITLALIADETDFTRGNLYKYISSKEDIYLLVLIDEVMNWIEVLDKQITVNLTDDISAFSRKWACIFYKHQRLLKLMSYHFIILEQNVSLDKLVAFKNQLNNEILKILDIVHRVFPQWSDTSVRRFIHLQNNYVIGLFPTIAPSDIQKKALEQSNWAYVIPDFVDDFSEFLEYTIRYLDSNY